MAIIPVFIYVREKNEKELARERARETRWAKLMKEEEEREAHRKEEEKRRKLREKEEKEERIRREVEIDMMRNPWDYKILPEGWSIFGQRYIGTLPWDGENPRPQKGYGYID